MKSNNSGGIGFVAGAIVLIIVIVAAYIVLSGDSDNPNDTSDFTEISTAEQLSQISENGKYILTDDIDLSTVQWAEIPIFNGTLDGDGHKIIGLTVNSTSPDSYHGMFIELGTKGIVRNLTFDQVNILSTKAGAVAGISSGTISNVTVSGIVGYPTGEYIGGIVGYHKQGTIEDSTNNANVDGAKNVGGIAGYSQGSIRSCENYGTITGSAANIGGIVGSIQYINGDTPGTANGCVNHGIIDCTGDYVGGIAGYGYSSGDIVDCVNEGSVKSSGSGTGGIIGYWSSSRTLMSNNLGPVEGNENVGGIVGYANMINNRISAQHCEVRSATIVGKTNVGGVVGYSNKTTVTNCNVDDNCLISGNSCIGGIVGRSSWGDVSNCTSYGLITSAYESSSNNSYGGMVGYFVGKDNSIENCRNYGSINVSGYYVGGIVGGTFCYPMFDVYITYCENHGSVTASGNSVAGIVGFCELATDVSNCLNDATITGNDYVYGIGGDKVYSSVNYGRIVCNGTHTGNIA